MEKLSNSKEKRNIRKSFQHDSDLMNSINIKLFRKKENHKKVQFILEKTDITKEIIFLANEISNLNPYHNFGHQLGVAETAIIIGETEGCSRKEVNLLALCGLFHDAKHLGKYIENAEENSYITAIETLPEHVFQKLQISKSEFFELIMATKIKKHGKLQNKLAKIIQDADLWWLARWPEYLLYTSMWILDEENINKETFLQIQEEFINKIQQESKSFFVSEWAKEVFIEPKEGLKILQYRPKEKIEKAYELRKQDISFEEFCKKLNDI